MTPPAPLVRPRPWHSIAAACAATAASAACGLSGVGTAPALPAMLVALGADRLVAGGLAAVILIGLVAAHVARLTATPASPGQAALPAAAAIALLMPGAGIAAWLPVLIAAAWLWRVERRPLARWLRLRPRPANDNHRAPPLDMLFAGEPRCGVTTAPPFITPASLNGSSST